MNMQQLPALVLAGAGPALVSLGLAGSSPAQDTPRFAAPQRVSAGDGFLGAGRLYPSPVVRDMDGDGIADVVVGDLIGNVTVAKRAGDGAVSADQPLKDRRGERLKFHNW